MVITIDDLPKKYLRVLETLKDGLPRSSARICEDCGFKTKLECSGNLRVLNSLGVIQLVSKSNYRISVLGREALKKKELKLTQRG